MADRASTRISETGEWMAPVLERLEKASCLKDGWAGEGSKAPTPKAISEARRFIDGLPSLVIPPRVNLAEDGEVVLEWRNTGHHIAVSISRDGLISFGLRSPGGYERGGTFKASEMMPIRLVQAIVVAGR